VDTRPAGRSLGYPVTPRWGIMKIKTHVKAGGIAINHNEALVRDRRRTLRLRS
jgi:hypothetical protein